MLKTQFSNTNYKFSVKEQKQTISQAQHSEGEVKWANISKTLIFNQEIFETEIFWNIWDLSKPNK